MWFQKLFFRMIYIHEGMCVMLIICRLFILYFTSVVGYRNIRVF